MQINIDDRGALILGLVAVGLAVAVLSPVTVQGAFDIIAAGIDATMSSLAGVLG